MAAPRTPEDQPYGMNGGTNASWPVQIVEDTTLDNTQSFPEDFDFEAAAKEYGPLPDFIVNGTRPGFDFSMTNDNHFNGDMAEALGAKTPGYGAFDTEDAYTTSPYHQSAKIETGFQTDAFNGTLGGQVARTPFGYDLSDGLDAKTPYVPPTPYMSSDPVQEEVTGGGIQDGNGNYLPATSPFTPVVSSIEVSDIVPLSPATRVEVANAKKVTKKTASTRAKGKGKAKAVVADEDEDDVEEIVVPGKLASGRRRKAAAGAATTSAAASAATGAAGAKKKTPAKKRNAGTTGTTTRKTRSSTKTATNPMKTMANQRVRQPPKNGIVQHKPIPSSLEECDEADKAMIEMRAAGCSWPEVKARYAELDGTIHGNSTLPNRHERLKTAFINMRAEDNVLLFDAKKEIEDDFAKKKWSMIAASVKVKSGIDYDPDDLRRRFKQLMEKEGFPVNEGLARQDVDFAIDPEAYEDEEDNDDDDDQSKRTAPDITWEGQEEDEDDDDDDDHGERMDVDADDEGDGELA